MNNSNPTIESIQKLFQIIENQPDFLQKQKDQEDQIKALNERLSNLELKVGKTDDEKCPKCETLKSALKENHLICYEWHFNKLVNPDVTQLCIDASRKGHLEVVKFLVSSGVNINSAGYPILHIASANGHLELVKFLVSSGANIHADDDYAIRSASQNGLLEVVKFLVESGANIHAYDDFALRYASKDGHLEVVKFLVSSGANIHAENDFALHEALKQKNIHAENDFALHEALKQKNMEMVNYLVSIWTNN